MRGRLAHQTEIGGADIQRFEQLRPRLKLDPRHRPPERRELPLEDATLLQEDEVAGPFLKRNTECLAIRLRARNEAADAENESRCQHLKTATIDHGPIALL